MNTELREVLVSGIDYMKRIPSNLYLLTEAISKNDLSTIGKNYNDIKEGLGWTVDALNYFQGFLKLDYANITVNKKDSQKIIEEYKKFIADIDTIYINQDYDTLSNIIDTELPKHLKKIISIFNKVKILLNNSEH